MDGLTALRPSPVAPPRSSSAPVRSPTRGARSPAARNAKIVLELFAGKSELTTALRRQGFVVLAFEILNGAEFDLTRRSTQQAVLSWIRAGMIEFVHLGVPCTVWSIARRGIKNWERARHKEDVSIALTFFTIEVF